MVETGWNYVVVSGGGSISPLVAGTSGKKIRVLAFSLDSNDGSATWKFQTSTGAARLTGNLFLSSGVAGSSTATGSAVFPYSPIGWFETLAGDDLDLIQVAGTAGIGGCLVYELV
jgi:hypothetical protein